MARSSRAFLLDTTGVDRILVVALAGFVGTFLAYAAEIFHVSGGIVFIPFYAAVVGMLAGAWVGYRRRGLVFGWLVAYTSLLGYRADHAFLGIAHRPIGHRFAYFFQPEGLVVFAVEGIVLGTLAFGLGYSVRAGLKVARTRRVPSSEN